MYNTSVPTCVRENIRQTLMTLKNFQKFTQGVPIEVVPFAYAKVLQNLHHILGSPNATLRMAIKKGWGLCYFVGTLLTTRFI